MHGNGTPTQICPDFRWQLESSCWRGAGCQFRHQRQWESKYPNRCARFFRRDQVTESTARGGIKAAAQRHRYMVAMESLQAEQMAEDSRLQDTAVPTRKVVRDDEDILPRPWQRDAHVGRSEHRSRSRERGRHEQPAPMTQDARPRPSSRFAQRSRSRERGPRRVETNPRRGETNPRPTPPRRSATDELDPWAVPVEAIAPPRQKRGLPEADHANPASGLQGGEELAQRTEAEKHVSGPERETPAQDAPQHGLPAETSADRRKKWLAKHPKWLAKPARPQPPPPTRQKPAQPPVTTQPQKPEERKVIKVTFVCQVGLRKWQYEESLPSDTPIHAVKVSAEKAIVAALRPPIRPGRSCVVAPEWVKSAEQSGSRTVRQTVDFLYGPRADSLRVKVTHRPDSGAMSGLAHVSPPAFGPAPMQEDARTGTPEEGATNTGPNTSSGGAT